MDHPVTQNLPNEQNDFNEEQWLKILFLISDTQAWLDDIQKGMIYQLPVEGKKKLLRKSFYLTSPAIAHIMERHYYKIQRYPDKGKFTIPVIEILACIRDSFSEPTWPINGMLYVQRVMDAGKTIGFDRSGRHTSLITVVSDNMGRIITAFPGLIKV